MASVIEVTAYCKDIIELKQVVDEINQLNYNVELISAEVIDDWEYNNYQDITSNFNWSDVTKNVLECRIFIAQLKVNSKFNIGYRVCITNDKSFEVSVWLNTDGLEYLDIDKIDKLNRIFYDNLTTNVINIIKDKSPILAGIGVETQIEYNNDILATIKNSSNIFRWIIPSDKSIQNEGINFIIQTFNHFHIYTKK